MRQELLAQHSTHVAPVATAAPLLIKPMRRHEGKHLSHLARVLVAGTAEETSDDGGTGDTSEGSTAGRAVSDPSTDEGADSLPHFGVHGARHILDTSPSPAAERLTSPVELAREIASTLKAELARARSEPDFNHGEGFGITRPNLLEGVDGSADCPDHWRLPAVPRALFPTPAVPTRRTPFMETIPESPCQGLGRIPAPTEPTATRADLSYTALRRFGSAPHAAPVPRPLFESRRISDRS